LPGGATACTLGLTVWTVPIWNESTAPANLMHGFSEHDPDATSQL
jgi:hypothetical protein